MSNVAVVIDSRFLQVIEGVLSHDEDFQILDRRDIGEAVCLSEIPLYEDVKSVIDDGGYTAEQREYLYSRITCIVSEVSKEYSFESYNDFIAASLEKCLDMEK